MREKIGIVTSQRSGELVVADDGVAVVPRFARSVRVRRRRCSCSPGRRATLPVVSYCLPFLVNTASRELTVCTMWFGPTARLLSEGLRPSYLPCGPSKPTPSPSKLSTSAAGGRGTRRRLLHRSLLRPAAALTNGGAPDQRRPARPSPESSFVVLLPLPTVPNAQPVAPLQMYPATGRSTNWPQDCRPVKSRPLRPDVMTRSRRMTKRPCFFTARLR